MPKIKQKDLPAFVRRAYDSWRKSNIDVRSSEQERLRAYAGGELMWRDAEVQKRKAQSRPIVTVNKCKPAVDQIEGDVILNPPGPQVMPLGDNPTDAADPDIIAGLIREVEYRSMSAVADSLAVRYCAISGIGVIELGTEYANNLDDQQQLVVIAAEDPAVYFWDTASRMANRQDAMWAGKIKAYSRDSYIQEFGKDRKILQPSGVQVAKGWMADALGIGSKDTFNLLDWTGTRDYEGRWNGPFLVCEFYMVETDEEKSAQYSNGIWYLDSQVKAGQVPEGVEPKGKDYERTVTNRKVVKYLVDALEADEGTEWLGSLIPFFPVLGPEIYIDGKLHRLSVISNAIDSNRALNYLATTVAEVAGLLPKSPYIGPTGSFEDDKWDTVNSEIYAYMEYTPVWVTNEQGQQVLAPAPERNTWAAEFSHLIQAGQWYSDHIKATTSIYDASLGQQKNDQSGTAIEQLRSESNVANISFSSSLHRAKTLMYQQMCEIFPKILDGPRAVQIVHPDSQAETVRINQLFPEDGIDPATGKKGIRNDLTLGKYSCRVIAGPNFQTRQEDALTKFLDAVKINPAILQNPAVTAKVVRMIGQGNPEMEGIADLLAPDPNGAMTPQQLAQQAQAAQAQVQTLMQVIQHLQMKIETQQPKIDADERKNIRDNAVKLAVAQIGAKSQDAARVSADRLTMLEMAHEAGTQAVEHEHASDLQDSQQQAAAASQTQAEQASAEQAATAGTGE